MSRGFSGKYTDDACKQSRYRLFNILQKRNNDFSRTKRTVWVSTMFTSILLAVKTFTEFFLLYCLELTNSNAISWLVLVNFIKCLRDHMALLIFFPISPHRHVQWRRVLWIRYICCLLSNQSCLEASKTSLGFSGFYGEDGYNSFGNCSLYTLSSQRYLILSEVCFNFFFGFLESSRKLYVWIVLCGL